jgi:hypothetical protein
MFSLLLRLAIFSDCPTLLSLNRFEGKKNIILALQAFSMLLDRRGDLSNLRLVLAGWTCSDPMHTDILPDLFLIFFVQEVMILG